MAAPVVASTAVTNISTAADPWTVNMPASIAAGDLLLYFIRIAGNVSMTNPTGTDLIRQDLSDASDDIQNIYGKIATGSEGATEQIQLASTAKGACIVARITGAARTGTWGSGGSIVECAAAHTNIGTTANANPNAITPTGGAKDYLYMVMLGMDHETATFSAGPAGYGAPAPVTANSGTAGAVATNCQIAIAGKGTTGTTTEDPGGWICSAPTTGFCSMT
jgi:hypothetical protein